MRSAVGRIDEIFWEAGQLPPGAERDAYLARACDRDTDLRRRVEQLLRVRPKAEGFLERPFAGPTTADLPAVGEGPGSVVGPYRLMEQIGEGGMGLVFVADQTHPVRRKVALKLIKPGMDSRQVIARFEAERQALALMDHPNIAKVHDGGTTPAGRPYFVMELVKGAPITDFCDRERLTTRQRLGLFVDVCSAVQHAHQKGVIHRDLKPSNILVTVHDVTPVVKVIDFGVAKATGERLTERTLYTAFAQLVGTPLYMSPEQAGLSGLDVDTRSDIYSLGVLLYKLLTGMTPFDQEVLHRAGHDEMRRMIREDEPPRPSTRLSTLAKAEVSTLAERRGVEPRRLHQEVRGELDWVVMKCLEKDRNRRYETASALAADVQRYLDDEPVAACPPSVAYRVRKFAQRNRPALVAVTVVTAALVGATAVSIWQAAKAWEAERRATTEAAIANAVKSFLQDDLLILVGPEMQVAQGFGVNSNLTVREALDRAAKRIGERFRDHPLVEAEIRFTIGKAYHGVREIGTAIGHLEKAVALYKTHLGPMHRKTLFVVSSLVGAMEYAGRFDEALALLAEWREHFQGGFGTEQPESTVYLHDCARICYRAGKLDDAERFTRHSLAIRRKFDPPTRRNDTMYTLAWLSRINIKQKKYAAAEAAAREALTILEQDTVPPPMGRYVLMSLLGGALLGQEKYSAAEPLLLKGYEGLAELVPTQGPLPGNRRLAEAIERIVWFYEATNQPEKARSWRDKLDPAKRANRDY